MGTKKAEFQGEIRFSSSAGTCVQEPAIRVDASEVLVVRRGHLPNWFRESLQKDIERLEAAERERNVSRAAPLILENLRITQQE